MSYEIRPARQEDLEQLVTLCKRHANFEGVAYSEEGKIDALNKALFIASSSLKAMVAAQGQKLIGYTTFVRQFSTWDAAFYLYMDCLYLDDAYRNMGIGQKLLEKVKKEAIALGCKEVQWQTPIDNEKAISFYKREGASIKEKARCFLNIENDYLS